jgi:hypothetical protein
MPDKSKLFSHSNPAAYVKLMLDVSVPLPEVLGETALQFQIATTTKSINASKTRSLLVKV